jgi:lysophospholipid acyltransferase (LPLAT)-like uncharacterized protein
MSLAPPAWLVRVLVRGFARMSRSWRVSGIDEHGATLAFDDYAWTPPALHAVSERDVLAFAYVAFVWPMVTLVAPGRDGDWATTAMRAAGNAVHRGAAGRRGYEGTLALVHDLRRDPRPAVMTVDGPLGPAGVAKEGVVTVAAACGLPIRPVAAAASRALTFPATWSGIYLPLPRATVAYAFAPLVTAVSARDQRQDAAARVTADLARASERALAVVRNASSNRWSRASAAPLA